MDVNERVREINEERVCCPFNGFNICVGESCGVAIGHEMKSPDGESFITYYTCGFAEFGDKDDGGLINIIAAEVGAYGSE